MAALPQEIQAARLRLVRERPYLTTLLYSLIPVEKEACPSMSVDAYMRLYFNPDYVKSLPQEQLCGMLYHALQHSMRDHTGRGKGNLNHPAWGIAADMEINDDIVEEKAVTGTTALTLPPDAFMPAHIGSKNGLLAEEYYEVLDKLPKETISSSGGQGKGQKKEGQSGKGFAAGHCGGLSGSEEAHGWDEGAPAELGGNSEIPGIGQGEQSILRNKTAEEIKEHSKTRGDIPAWMVRWAEELTNPKVNWRRQLSSVVRRAVARAEGLVDYTYVKPSRRQSAFPQVVTPSFFRPEPKIAIVIDTSGSVSQKMLTRALTEVDGILKSMGVRSGVTVFSVDAQAGNAQKVMKAESVKLTGGGGTDMGIGIAAMAKMRPRPHIGIVFTDCYTPWPTEAPPYEAVIVDLAKGGTHPDWGTIISVPEED